MALKVLCVLTLLNIAMLLVNGFLELDVGRMLGEIKERLGD